MKKLLALLLVALVALGISSTALADPHGTVDPEGNPVSSEGQ